MMVIVSKQQCKSIASCDDGVGSSIVVMVVVLEGWIFIRVTYGSALSVARIAEMRVEATRENQKKKNLLPVQTWIEKIESCANY